MPRKVASTLASATVAKADSNANSNTHHAEIASKRAAKPKRKQKTQDHGGASAVRRPYKRLQIVKTHRRSEQDAAETAETSAEIPLYKTRRADAKTLLYDTNVSWIESDEIPPSTHGGILGRRGGTRRRRVLGHNTTASSTALTATATAPNAALRTPTVRDATRIGALGPATERDGTALITPSRRVDTVKHYYRSVRYTDGKNVGKAGMDGNSGNTRGTKLTADRRCLNQHTGEGANRNHKASECAGNATVVRRKSAERKTPVAQNTPRKPRNGLHGDRTGLSTSRDVRGSIWIGRDKNCLNSTSDQHNPNSDSSKQPNDVGATRRADQNPRKDRKQPGKLFALNPDSCNDPGICEDEVLVPDSPVYSGISYAIAVSAW